MQSQRVTKNDIARGQVRFASGAKVMFPGDPATVEFTLGGQSLSGKWDPGFGSDKERSGILRVGRAALEALVAPEEILELARAGESLTLS